MQVKQWITNPAVNTTNPFTQEAATPPVPTALQTSPFGQFGAFRIAFQALPGTVFCLKGTGGETEIVMGPTGIYELGFSRALIRDFCVKSVIGDSNTAVMILDALIATTNDETINTYDQALLAENYDISETSINLMSQERDEDYVFWNLPDDDAEPPSGDDQDQDPTHQDGTWIVGRG